VLETCASVLEDDAAGVAAGALVETTAAAVELTTGAAEVELATGEAEAEAPLAPSQTAGPGIVYEVKDPYRLNTMPGSASL
jgi:hypothetical protein